MGRNSPERFSPSTPESFRRIRSRFPGLGYQSCPSIGLGQTPIYVSHTAIVFSASSGRPLSSTRQQGVRQSVASDWKLSDVAAEHRRLVNAQASDDVDLLTNRPNATSFMKIESSITKRIATAHRRAVLPEKPRRASVAAFHYTFALALLLSATCARAAEIVARFDVVQGAGAGIFADGNRLLVDDLRRCGFYVIGSNDQTDDANNIASHSPYSREGVMRPFNNDLSPFIPYSFRLERDAKISTRLNFQLTIGPSAFDFTTISLPLDGRREHFTHYRHAGAPTVLNRYDRLPYAYTPPGGHPTYLTIVPGKIPWAEMIGPEYTIRVTYTRHSRPSPGMAFVRAPNLSTGVHNVECGFGPVKRGEKLEAAGYIDVSRTPASLFAMPTLTIETEAHGFHQIGRAEGNGWAVKVGDKQNSYSSYGPYTTAVEPGSRTANFRLQLDNTTADNLAIVRIDVFDAASGRVLAQRDIHRREFSSPFSYQDFALKFVAQGGQKLEFRTYWYGFSYMKQDHARIN